MYQSDIFSTALTYIALKFNTMPKQLLQQYKEIPLPKIIWKCLRKNPTERPTAKELELYFSDQVTLSVIEDIGKLFE